MKKHDLTASAPLISRLLNEHRSQAYIAKTLNIGRNCLRRHLVEMGITFPHKTGPKPGQWSKLWRGGIRISHAGYVEVFFPEHPSCASSNASRKSKSNDQSYNRKKYVQLHRLVIENSIERFLEPRETVHHANGNRLDNQLSNLELFSNNTLHLAHELAGKTPQWTEAGKQNLRIAANAKAGIRPGVPLSGVPSYIAGVAHLKTLPRTYRKQISRTERKRLQEQVVHHSMPILKTLTWFPQLLARYGLEDQKS